MRRKKISQNLDEFFTLDIETWKNETMRLGVLYSEKIQTNDNALLFTNFDELFNYLIYNIKNKKFTIYSHYGGGFDFLYILDYLIKDKKLTLDELNFVDSQGLLISLEFTYQNKHFIFKDSFALFRCSLEKIANSLLNKSKLDIDIENRDELSEFELYEYCRHDCYILYYSLLEFRKIVVQDFKLSIASQALDNFLKFHCKSEFGKQSYFEYKLLKQFYFGGRVECFKRYGESLYQYDVNNMYGFVMKEYGAPVGKIHFVNNRSTSNAVVGFYGIKLEKDYDLYIPFLHAKIGEKKYNKKLYFLNSSELIFRCTSLELSLLDNFGMKYKIISAIEFDYDKDFFKSYVEFWSNKIYTDPDRKFIYKLMINSLYGKFGQKREFDKIVIGDNLDSYLNEKYNIGYKKTINNFLQYNYVNISAWITSAARYELFKYLWRYRKNVYYTDTDSLFLDREVNTNDFDNYEFGKLKLENKIERGYFLTQKMYCLVKNDGIESVVKGFRRKQFSEEQFQKALYNDVFDFKESQRKIRKIKSALRTGNDFIQYYDCKKMVNEINLKRKILENKIDTIPFIYKNKKLN